MSTTQIEYLKILFKMQNLSIVYTTDIIIDKKIEKRHRKRGKRRKIRVNWLSLLTLQNWTEDNKIILVHIRMTKIFEKSITSVRRFLTAFNI